MNNDKLNILWTNGDEITSEKMVMMYATNCLLQNWWKEVTVILWGEPNKLVAENEMIQEKIKLAIHAGVHFSACKACSDQLGTTELLKSLGVEVKYWGEGLTEILKEDAKLLTV